MAQSARTPRAQRSLAWPQDPCRGDEPRQRALVLGALKQPWTLTAAAAVVIVHDHTALPLVVVAFLVFTVISTASVGGIYVYFSRRPGEAQARLDALSNRLVKAGPALFAIVSFLVGVYLVVDGSLSLAGI